MFSDPQTRTSAFRSSTFQISNDLGILVANRMLSRSFHVPKLNQTDENCPHERVLLENGRLIERQKTMV
jgi:hypothetical protein